MERIRVDEGRGIYVHSTSINEGTKEEESGKRGRLGSLARIKSNIISAGFA